MSQYLTVNKQGICTIHAEQPEDYRDYVVVSRFDTAADCERAKFFYDMNNRGNEFSSFAAASDAEIEDLSNAIEVAHERIDKLTERKNYWSEQYSHQVTRTTQLVTVLTKVCHTLAVSTCVQATHRERNEMCRELVRTMMQAIQQPSYGIDSTIPQDMDDIPF